MFIGVLGSTCAGKRTVIDYLTSKGFIELAITSSESGSNPEQAEQAETETLTQSSVVDASFSRQVFKSTTSLLDFVTRNWRTNYVALFNINGDNDDATLLEVSVRPFFLVLIVDAPILQRWRRLQLVGSETSTPGVCDQLNTISSSSLLVRRKRPNEAQSLETFLETNDGINTGNPKVDHGTAQVSLINDLPSNDALFSKLDALDLLNPERLRPSWDSYFMVRELVLFPSLRYMDVEFCFFCLLFFFDARI